MTQKDIALYYEQLTRGEKGRFTAFIGSTGCCVLLGIRLFAPCHQSSSGNCAVSLRAIVGERHLLNDIVPNEFFL